MGSHGRVAFADWSVDVVERVARLKLGGEVDLAAVDAGLPKHIEDAVGTSHTVECDLSRVTFFDSSGVHTLLSLKKTTEERGSKFVLVATSAQVASVLDLTGLSEQFTEPARVEF